MAISVQSLRKPLTYNRYLFPLVLHVKYMSTCLITCMSFLVDRSLFNFAVFFLEATSFWDASCFGLVQSFWDGSNINKKQKRIKGSFFKFNDVVVVGDDDDDDDDELFLWYSWSTVVRNPHHRESSTRCEQYLSRARNWVQA